MFIHNSNSNLNERKRQGRNGENETNEIIPFEYVS